MMLGTYTLEEIASTAKKHLRYMTSYTAGAAVYMMEFLYMLLTGGRASDRNRGRG